MPDTPVSWRPQQTVSLVEGLNDVTNDQYDPKIIQLTNGDLLVTYTTNLDTSTSLSVVSRRYDALGDVPSFALSFEIPADTISGVSNFQLDAAALPDGGYITVWEDRGASGNEFSIRLREFDADADVDANVPFVAQDINGAVPNYFNPHIAVATASIVLVTYEVHNALGDVDIEARYYNSVTDTLFAPLTVFNGGSGLGEGLEGHSLTALNNDTFVVAWADQDAGSNDDVQFSIVNLFTGASAPTTVYNGTSNSSDPHVVALTGGGFVVTWVIGNPSAGNSGVRARVYDSTGANPSAVINPLTTTAGNQLAPAVAALQDGGFVIVWYDASTQDIHGQRFNDAGTKIGDEFDIDTDAVQIPGDVDIDVQGMADGRFAVTWTESRPSGVAPGGGSGHDIDVHMSIWDPRDDENTPIYLPDSWQVGTVGNDSINATADIVHGWGGRDRITDGAGANHLFGDSGNDRITIQGISGLESADGGSGIDTLIGTSMQAGTVYDLLLGRVERNGVMQEVTGFENLEGSLVDETIYGTNSANFLSGGGGSNSIFARGGNDRLYMAQSAPGDLDFMDGQDGIDTVEFDDFHSAVWVDLDYTGSTGIEAWTRDSMDVTSGTWRGIAHLQNIENVIGSFGSDAIYGDDLANVITPGWGDDIVRARGGNDHINLRNGYDDVDGGMGTDLADFSRYNFAVWVDLDYAGPTGSEAWHRSGNNVTSGVWTAIANLENIENLVGTVADDELRGDSGANVISDGEGDDRAWGRGGNDTFIYDSGLDDYNGEAGTDTADFSNYTNAIWVDLSYAIPSGYEVWTTGGGSIDPVAGSWMALANLTGIENVIGTALADIFYDDLGNNAFSGGYGNDQFRLGGGFDIVDGGLSTDLVSFFDYQSAVWVDLAYTGPTGYEAWTRGGTDVLSGPWQAIADLTGIENVAGSNFNDRLVGDASFNILSGGNGNDSLIFSEGRDEYRGQGGADTIDMSGAAFAVWIGLEYFGPEVWTKDDTDLIGGTWRSIGELFDVENMIGSAYDDYLRGDGENNRMDGGDGDDRFVFDDNFGDDTIVGFQDTGSGFEDVIDFSLNASVNSLADVNLSFNITTGDTTVSTADGTITLLDTAGIGLTDFVF